MFWLSRHFLALVSYVDVQSRKIGAHIIPDVGPKFESSKESKVHETTPSKMSSESKPGARQDEFSGGFPWGSSNSFLP